MFKPISWTFLITTAVAGGLHYYDLHRMHYTLSDYEQISSIKGEAEIMLNEKKFCTPDDKREQDLTTCGLWREKHHRLIKLGPNGLAAFERKEEEAIAAINPMSGDEAEKD